MQSIPSEIKSWYAPIIVNTPSGRYGILDGRWYTIADSETLESLHNRWVRVDWRGEPYQADKPIQKVIVKEYKVVGSDGKKTYTVTVSGDSVACTCTGYGFRSRCKHVDQIKKTIAPVV